MGQQKKIVITGGAGLVGQNLLTLLKDMGQTKIVTLDKHAANLAILKQLNPWVGAIESDLAVRGPWMELFKNADIVIQLHAQITGPREVDFKRNNIEATRLVLEACAPSKPYMIHVSSSVVHSKAIDFYTESKKLQERLVQESGLDYVVLRPTLMFGWFDAKHFGWLRRFMEKTPIFPIPGSGRYLRQPLYIRDFCRAICYCIKHQPKHEIYDLVGSERIDFVDIIRTIRKVTNSRTLLLPIPYRLFKWLMQCYGFFSSNPPFTPQQLEALTIGDIFEGVNLKESFDIEPTPFKEAIHETLTDPRYKDVVLSR